MKLKAMKKQLLLIVSIIIVSIAPLNAQVKIGNNPDSINNNSLLELESATKGFLPPRVAINDIASPSPLTAPVPAGMMVYSLNGSVSDGFYNWDGSKWVKLSTSSDHINTVTKTSNSTLQKTENMVLASNDITITLPVVTSADNGLEMTVKNIGSYTDLIAVRGNGSALIDNVNDIDLYRWDSKTFIAYEGNWLLKVTKHQLDNVFNVDTNGSWTTVTEVIEFLNLHMKEPSVVQFCGGTFPVSETQVINLPYPVTFQGTSFGETEIAGTAGVSGMPMFICQTECYFKMLMFSAYANTPGNDAIHFTGSNTYNEVKDADFTGFNKSVVATTNTDLWIFESDFNNIADAALEIAAGSASDGSLKVSECDFMNCAKGLHLKSGLSETVSVLNTTFYNTAGGGDIGILYVPATFTLFKSIFISNSAWNNQGTFVSGFDFSRSDGRDANADIVNNIGIENEIPHCKINVLNNSNTITIYNNGTFYKPSWTNAATSYTCKWTLSGNKMTYQPNNTRDIWAVISGDISVNNSNRVITIAIYKNGLMGTKYGETDLRVTNSNQPFQFSTVIYIPSVKKNDFLELYVTSSSSNDVVTFQDVQWFTNTQ
jgi:hypothetical protein